MYYLGIDLGSSSIKLALVNKESGNCLALIKVPAEEMSISAIKKDWAEQSPEDWWNYLCSGIKRIITENQIDSKSIIGLGISYQMHGLVIIDEAGRLIRDSIIWCDSRAVEVGEKAFTALGQDYCDTHLLNSPANFTASKLGWVSDNESSNYQKVHKFMLPGDYIAYRLSSKINTTIGGLSEGIFWDFKNDELSDRLIDHFGFDRKMMPDVVDTFAEQSVVSEAGAAECGLAAGTPILYRAGDQPNNALALNVFQSGEVAMTGGTSGVIYAVTDGISARETYRLNSFAHVNYNHSDDRILGKLLCINGAGIQYRWLLNNLDVDSYEAMNELASKVDAGVDGLTILPFGNGSERILYNKNIGTRILGLNLNRHHQGHICRAALEGIAFAFVYGMEIIQNDGNQIKRIKAGHDNLFRSEVFAQTLSSLIDKEIEIYNTTGAIGAARACIIATEGLEAYSAYTKRDYIKSIFPDQSTTDYRTAYQKWKQELENALKQL